MDSYDVIIIGTGAGGGTLARHLAPSGKRILLLERGDWLPREPSNWSAHDVFVDNRYVSDGHLVRRERQVVPAADPLLRRRGDEALRRSALPPPREGLRRAPAPRRHLARLADLLRRAGAVLHARPSSCTRCTERAARTRPSRRRARPYPFPARLARAADPAALGRPRRRRLPPVPCAVRGPAERGQHALQPLRPLHHLRRLPVPRARQVGRRGARRAPGARASERDAADEREGREARDERLGESGLRGRRRARTARPSASRRTWSSWPAARPTRPSCCSPRPTSTTRTASPTAPTRSAATTCSTTRSRCSRSRGRRTRPCSRRRSG